MKKQIIFLVGAFWLITINAKAQNMVSPTSWTIGSGSVTGFTMYGATTANEREWGEGPLGRTILWKGIPDGGGNSNGGFITPYYPIDHTKMYRLTIWLKKTGSMAGSSYLGSGVDTGQPSLTKLDNVANSNPYFLSADLPALDKWYLVVGYIHGSGDASTVSIGGVYDGVTGAKVASTTDWKFQINTTSIRHRSFLANSLDVNDRQYIFAPRMEVVNGDEPTIEALLGLNTQTAVSGSALYPSKMGINTTSASMGTYELAVNGEIRAKEIKVETGWSDFVFENDYKLISLEELEAYILANKHLPVIPSAKEVEANGISLGEMDKLLLQKIEELTLYMIELKKENEVLRQKVEVLEKQ